MQFDLLVCPSQTFKWNRKPNTHTQKSAIIIEQCDCVIHRKAIYRWNRNVALWLHCNTNAAFLWVAEASSCNYICVRRKCFIVLTLFLYLFSAKTANICKLKPFYYVDHVFARTCAPQTEKHQKDAKTKRPLATNTAAVAVVQNKLIAPFEFVNTFRLRLSFPIAMFCPKHFFCRSNRLFMHLECNRCRWCIFHFECRSVKYVRLIWSRFTGAICIWAHESAECII